MEKKIFISYKRQDRDLVFPIVDEIKKKTSVDCWIDLDGIESGDQFEHVIIQALKSCDILLFMMSKQSIAPYIDPRTGKADPSVSTWTEREVKFALDRKKRVIPVSIDGTMVNDCDWLAFNCSGIDSIDYANVHQREKFFRNLCRWCGTTYQEEIAAPKPQPKPVVKPETQPVVQPKQAPVVKSQPVQPKPVVQPEPNPLISAEKEPVTKIPYWSIAAGAAVLIGGVVLLFSSQGDEPATPATESAKTVVAEVKDSPEKQTDTLSLAQQAAEAPKAVATSEQVSEQKPDTKTTAKTETKTEPKTEIKPAATAPTSITVPNLSAAELVKLAGDYMNGANGKTKDAKTAAAYLSKAATDGNAQAQDLLGKCYLTGTGVTKDNTKAFTWFKKSAEQGFADAQLNVASCYYNGMGVARDIESATRWYEKAAAQGNATAQAFIDKLNKAAQ